MGAARVLVHTCAGYLGCAILLAAAFLTARLAYADVQFRRDTPAAVKQAAYLDRFAPPAGYFERLVDLDPERTVHWLDAALANPRSSSIWIAQGLAAERAGRFEQAGRDLLQAAHIDRRYLPAWTLANFQFRQISRNRGDEIPTTQFWVWARRAAELTYDDFRPLLALAQAVEPDPRVALQKLGGGDALLRVDLDYLAARERYDDAQEVARLMLARRAPADDPRVLELADRQIRAGNASYALELWNAVAPRLHDQRLDPQQGPVLANADLQRLPSGVGFDWRLPRIEGAMAAWRPSELTFSLSGDQPEDCALLEQIVPVARSRLYRLEYEYMWHFEHTTAGLASPTGIRWDLDGDEGPALKPADAWVAAAAVLRASTAGLGRLRLLYRREPGTVRTQGRLELRHLRMEVL